MAVESGLCEFDTFLIQKLMGEIAFNPNAKGVAVGNRFNSVNEILKSLFSFPVRVLDDYLDTTTTLPEDEQIQIMKEFGMEDYLRIRGRKLNVGKDINYLGSISVLGQSWRAERGEVLFLLDRHSKASEGLYDFIEDSKYKYDFYTNKNSPDFTIEKLLKRCEVGVRSSFTPLILNPGVIKAFLSILNVDSPEIYNYFKNTKNRSFSEALSDGTLKILNQNGVIEDVSSVLSRTLKDMPYPELKRIYSKPASPKEPSFKVMKMMRIALDEVLGFKITSNSANVVKGFSHKEAFPVRSVLKNGALVVSVVDSELVLNKSNNTNDDDTLEAVRSQLFNHIKNEFKSTSIGFIKNHKYLELDAPSVGKLNKKSLSFDGLKNLVLFNQSKEEKLFIKTYSDFIKSVLPQGKSSEYIDNLEMHIKTIGKSLFNQDKNNPSEESPFLKNARNFFNEDSLLRFFPLGASDEVKTNKVIDSEFFSVFLTNNTLPKMDVNTFNIFVAPISMYLFNNKVDKKNVFHKLGDEVFVKTSQFIWNSDYFPLAVFRKNISQLSHVYNCFERPHIFQSNDFKRSFIKEMSDFWGDSWGDLISVALNQDKEKIKNLADRLEIQYEFKEPKVNDKYLMSVNINDIPGFDGLGNVGDENRYELLFLRALNQSLSNVASDHVSNSNQSFKNIDSHYLIKVQAPPSSLVSAIKDGKRGGNFCVSSSLLLDLGNNESDKFKELEDVMPHISQKIWSTLAISKLDMLRNQEELSLAFIQWKNAFILRGEMDKLVNDNSGDMSRNEKSELNIFKM